MLEYARIPVDVTKLSAGMYVSMLDRPWLETPFVFQGFEIRDRWEIEQLQAHCSYVYVDVERGSLTEAQIHALQSSSASSGFPRRPAHARSNPAADRLKTLAIRYGLGRFLGSRYRRRDGTYRVLATVRREAPAAREAWEKGVARHRRLREHARRAGTVEGRVALATVEPLIDSILRNPDAMAWTVFSRKRSGHQYSRALATSVWCILFGRHLGFDRSDLVELGIGGMLLDIGNVALPVGLVEAAGAITEAQYEYVMRHVEAGVNIVADSGEFGERILEMVRCHHERYDGSGYPDGLAGKDIPVFGRIAGIADCYDAMTSKTPYSPALAAYDAARELNGMRDRAFQTEVVEQFLHTIGMFPTGSVVELNDGKVGVVLEQNRAHPLRPKVMLLLDKNGETYARPRIVNMTDLDRNPGGGRAWIEKGHEHGAFGIDPQAYFA